MDDELARLYSRWRAADHTDRDDEADAAFRALSEALLPERAVTLEFTALVAALDLVIRSIVWVSTGPNLSVWSALNGVGRASAAFIADPKVTVIMFTIQATAIAAFVALRRLLGSDREFLE